MKAPMLLALAALSISTVRAAEPRIATLLLFRVGLILVSIPAVITFLQVTRLLVTRICCEG